MDLIEGQYSMTHLQWMCQRANHANYNVNILFKGLKRVYNQLLNFLRSPDVEGRLDAGAVEGTKRNLKPFLDGVNMLKEELDDYVDTYNFLQALDHEDDRHIIRANTTIFCTAPRGVIRTFISEATRVHQRTIDKLESLVEEQEPDEP